MIDIDKLRAAWEEIVQDRYDIADEHCSRNPGKDAVGDIVGDALPILIQVYIEQIQAQDAVVPEYQI